MQPECPQAPRGVLGHVEVPVRGRCHRAQKCCRFHHDCFLSRSLQCLLRGYVTSQGHSALLRGARVPSQQSGRGAGDPCAPLGSHWLRGEQQAQRRVSKCCQSPCFVGQCQEPWAGRRGWAAGQHCLYESASQQGCHSPRGILVPACACGDAGGSIQNQAAAKL